MPTFFEPGWLLLLWCGLAAAIVALPIRADRRSTLRPGPGRRLLSVALELLLFPVAYAAVLEALGRADLVTGAALGTVHAAVGVLVARAGHAPAGANGGAAVRTLLARVLYGIVFAFLYVVPPP